MKKFVQLTLAFSLALSLISVTGCAGTTKQESTGEYLDDSVITTKVKTLLFNEPSLHSSNINVETYKGIVQLSGFVHSNTEISRAVEITRSVNGVKGVKNNMLLR